jgi:exodeoxyribonuclease VII large subunit
MSQPPANDVKPLSIGQVTAQIKELIEGHFPPLWIVGEVSSMSIPGSGHVYFTLKDKYAILPAVMWKTTAQRYRYAMKDGQEVVVRGKLGVYAPQGRYQFTVDEMHLKGEGAQELALRRLKEKLQRLGYFAPERKKPLPAFPRRIVLVASPTGAAIRDMIEIIGRRWPCAEVCVCGVRVQGPGAAQEIVYVLNRLNHYAGIDVILLGRGGGSQEDLAVFNDEFVAEAIFKSRVPIVSAVGHEIDVTIADLVADRRAETPSAAAEIATPDRVEWLQRLHARQQRLHDLLMAKYRDQRQRLHSLGQRRVFRFPMELLHDRERRLDDCEARLRRAMEQRLQRLRHKVEASAGQLASLSPLNVLARGYSLTRTVADKHVVGSVGQVKAGDSVEIVLTDGRLQAEVKEVAPARDRAHGERTENL